MWGYIKKFLDSLIFVVLIEVAIVVTYYSVDTLVPAARIGVGSAMFALPLIFTGLTIVSALRLREKRAYRREEDPVSTVGLIIILVLGAALLLGAALATGLYITNWIG